MKKEIEIIILCVLLFVLGIAMGLMINKAKEDALEQEVKKNGYKNMEEIENQAIEYYSVSENIQINLPNNWSLFKSEYENHSFVNSDTRLYLKDWEEKGSAGFGWIIDTIDIKKVNIDEYNTKSVGQKIIDLNTLAYYKVLEDAAMTMDRDNVNVYYLKFNHGEVYKLISPKDIGNNFIAEQIINNFKIVE